MIKSKKHFRKWRVDRDDDVAKYEVVLNDPLCTITEKTEVKETIKLFDDEGRMTSMETFIYFLVHWTEKLL